MTYIHSESAISHSLIISVFILHGIINRQSEYQSFDPSAIFIISRFLDILTALLFTWRFSDDILIDSDPAAGSFDIRVATVWILEFEPSSYRVLSLVSKFVSQIHEVWRCWKRGIKECILIKEFHAHLSVLVPVNRLIAIVFREIDFCIEEVLESLTIFKEFEMETCIEK